MLGFDGQVVQMRCKIYTQIKDINKFSVPKLDFLSKHVGHHKVLVAMLGVKMGDHYFLRKLIHVANEKLYLYKDSKTMLQQITHGAIQVDKKSNLCNLL